MDQIFELATEKYKAWKSKVDSKKEVLYDSEDLYEKYKTIINYAKSTTTFWKKTPIEQMMSITTNKEFYSSNFSKTLSSKISFKDVKNQFLKSVPLIGKDNQIFLSAGKSGKLSFFLYDKNMWVEYIAMFLKLFYLGGVEFRSNLKIAFLGTIDYKHTLYRVASNFPKSQTGIFGLQRPMNEFLDDVLNFNPDIIVGYSSAVTIAVKGLSNKIRPKLVITSTDYLSEDSRNNITEEWDAKVINTFTMTEAGVLAFECPYGNMHVNEEHIFLKKIDGKLTLTNLVNKAQPLFNYVLPDSIKIAEDTSCPCLLKSKVVTIMGRGREYKALEVKMKDKILNLHPILIRSVLDNIDGVIDYNYKIDAGNLFLDINLDETFKAEKIKTLIENGFLKFGIEKEFLEQLMISL